MAIGAIPAFLTRRLVNGFTKSEYAIPRWIGQSEYNDFQGNDIMCGFYYNQTIIESTRLEF